MKNYICIDGKKAELTEEQLKALGIEIKEDSIFELNRDKVANYINAFGQVVSTNYIISKDNYKSLHEVANYCTDKELLQQRAYEETLNRLLWRYSMEHDGDKIDWNKPTYKYYIWYDPKLKQYNDWGTSSWCWVGLPCFYSKRTAKNAIEEIVEPFMRDHPDFIPR